MTLERSPIAELIAPLTTTSEKIRAMARAGYLRTEISEALHIRYQHVRKVPRPNMEEERRAES